MPATPEPLVPIELPAPSGEQTEVATVVLFKIGDTEYRIPEKPNANVALKYLKDVRDKGEDFAAANLLATLLGEDGFNDLAEYDELTDTQFEAVMKAAQKHVLGAMEKTRGNSGRGPRR